MPRSAAALAASFLLVACYGQSSSSGDGPRDENGDSAATGSEGPAFPCFVTQSVADDVVLRTQADVAALRGVSSLGESLLITGEVQDLSDLACLSHISGDLLVGETTVLTNLSGLENLRSVGGRIHIGKGCQYQEPPNCHGNLALESIAALRNVEHAGMIIITGECFGESQTGCTQNLALTKVEFDRITDLSGVGIVGNPALVEARFDALTHAGGLMIEENQHLRSMAFGALTEVDGELRLEDLPELTDVAFGELTTVAERFHVAATDLSDLSGFGRLETVSFLTIRDNPALLALDGVQPKELVWLTIWDNPLLKDLRALASLRSVRTSVNIRGNPSLPTCEASWLIDSIGESNIRDGVLIEDTDDSASCSP